jgi:predicted enzyme related to lactoylglutathione lyase
MPKQASHGRFAWHELTVTHPSAAESFYLQVTPWKTQPWDHSPDYMLLTNESMPLGGIACLSDDHVARGVPPHWLPYVCVYDVDASSRQAVSLGGQIRTEPKEVPNIGAWAVIADPQGAVFGIYEPAYSLAPPDPRPGQFSWHELATSDYKAAADFYRALFRWEHVSDYDMGEMGIYRMFGQRGETYGGMFNRKDTTPPPNWLPYMRVNDVKSAAGQVQQAGGTVINGPMEVPGGDWIAQCLDPQGAAFALHAR